MSGKTQHSLVPTAVVILFLCCLNGVDRATPRTFQTSQIEQPQFEQLQLDGPDFSGGWNDILEAEDQSEQAISSTSKAVETPTNYETENSLVQPEQNVSNMKTVAIVEESQKSSDTDTSSHIVQIDSNGLFEHSGIDNSTALNEAVGNSFTGIESELAEYKNEPRSPEPELQPAPELLSQSVDAFIQNTATESAGGLVLDDSTYRESDGSDRFDEIASFSSAEFPSVMKSFANHSNHLFAGKEILKFSPLSIDFRNLSADRKVETNKNFLGLVELKGTSGNTEFLRTGFKDYISGTRQLKLSGVNVFLDRLSVHGSLFESSGRIQISKYIEFRGNLYVNMAGLNARGEYRLYLINLPLVKKIRIVSRYFDFSSPSYGFHEPGLGRGFKFSVDDFSLSDMRFLSFTEFQFPPFLGGRGIVASIIHNSFNGFELRLLIDLPNITFKDVPGKLRLPNYDWRFR